MNEAQETASTRNSAYKDAGVDIDAADDLIQRIGPEVKKTQRAGVVSGLGGFGALFDPKACGLKDPILVSSTDGVGTKLRIAIETGLHDTVGQDLVAMCANDVVVQGAKPLFFLDYFATGKLDVEKAEAVINGIAKACDAIDCALIGGETAEMPGMYHSGDYDLAGFCVGAVEREALRDGSMVQEGDVILGLSSDGIHSNGFSLVRRIVLSSQGQSYSSPSGFMPGKTLGQALMVPTRLYVKPVLEALEQTGDTITGMAHITGGGIVENVPRCYGKDLMAEIDVTYWRRPAVFDWLKEHGSLTADDMLRSLNCGIGFVVVCRAKSVEAVKNSLSDSGEKVQVIGHIKKRGSADPAISILNKATL